MNETTHTNSAVPVPPRVRATVNRLGGAFFIREFRLGFQILGLVALIFGVSGLGLLLFGVDARQDGLLGAAALIVVSLLVHFAIGFRWRESFLFSAAVSAICLVFWGAFCFMYSVPGPVWLGSLVILFFTAFFGYRLGCTRRNK